MEKKLSKASENILKFSIISKEDLDLDETQEVLEDMTQKIEQKNHVHF